MDGRKHFRYEDKDECKTTKKGDKSWPDGYATACIGKWHLGWDWPLKAGGTANDGGDFSGPVDVPDGVEAPPAVAPVRETASVRCVGRYMHRSK